MRSRKPRLVLHIGQHKTGSKALQSFLAHNRETLRSHGILYPTDDSSCFGIRAYAISQFRLYALLRHEAILACFGSAAADSYWKAQSRFCAPFDSSYTFLKSIDDYLRHARLNQVALSAEDLFDMHTAHELAFAPELIPAAAHRFANLTSEFGYDVRVVVYLRRQDHLLGAHYVQFIKGNSDQDIDFESFARAFAPRLDAYAQLTRWAEAFGRERICVRPYERATLPQGIVPDFFEQGLKIPVPAQCVPPPADAESLNPSLDRDFIEFIRILNRQGASGQPVFARDAVLEAALSSQSSAQRPSGISAWLSPEARNRLRDTYHESNAAIAREYLNHSNGQLFAEPWPEHTEDWKPYPEFTPDRATAIAHSVHETIFRRHAAPVPSVPHLTKLSPSSTTVAGTFKSRWRRTCARLTQKLRTSVSRLQ